VSTRARTSIERGIAYLRSAQSEAGTWGEGDYAPAMTSLAVTGMLRAGKLPVDDPAVAKALKALDGFTQSDGGIYVTGSKNRNYPTAIALLAYVEANRAAGAKGPTEGKYADLIAKATACIKTEQWDEGEGIDGSNTKYGGAGYGSKSRPDLSNTAFFLDALQSAGVPKDDPAYKRALVFISRCQNLSGEDANDLAQAGLVDDGGFYYTPAEDYNPGGKTANGGLRSYASMTYAGLKSFIHAGLDREDRRVKAAWEWIRKNYSLEENPGLGQMGLFYYYHTFAKALDLVGDEEFVVADGQPRDWRADLVNALSERQQADGSWTNPEKRWMEDDRRLVTAYALLALSYAAN
jgi:squalene-hopene/tetraprenyl-beta-curcumene cyclase